MGKVERTDTGTPSHDLLQEYRRRVRAIEQSDQAYAKVEELFERVIPAHAQANCPERINEEVWNAAVQKLARSHLMDWSQGIYNNRQDIATIQQWLPTPEQWLHENLQELNRIVSNIQPDHLLPQRR